MFRLYNLLFLSILGLIILGTLPPLSGAPPNPRIDSLESAYQSANKDTHKLFILKQLGHENLATNPPQARDYAQQLRVASLELQFNKGVVWSDLLLSGYFKEVGDQPKQLFELNEALAGARKIKAVPEMIAALRGLARLYADLERIEMAIECLNEAIDLCEFSPEKQLKVTLLMDAAIVYQNIDSTQQALDLYQSALKHARKNQEGRQLTMCLANLGRLEKDLGMYEQALPHLKEALSLIEARDVRDGGAYVNAMLADFFYRTGNNRQSLVHTEKSYEAAVKQGGLQNIALAAEDVSKASERLHLYTQALDYARISARMLDSAAHDETLALIAEKDAQFDAERLEMELTHQNLRSDLYAQQKLGRQHVVLVSLSAGMVLLLTLLTLTTRQSQQRQSLNEQLLLEAQERKRSENELNTFLYRSSHDFKGPLASTQGLLQLAKIENESVEVGSYIDMATEKVTHLSSLLRRLVHSVAILEREMQPESVDPAQTWATLLPDLQKLPGFNAQDITFTTSGPWHIDPKILSVILRNLVSNSIIFCDEDKPSSTISIDFQHAANQQVLSITDNGIGIPPEIQSKVTDMFYQGSNKSIGNGLGLYLVEKLVRRLGGELKIESAVSQGTCVRVTLPG